MDFIGGGERGASSKGIKSLNNVSLALVKKKNVIFGKRTRRRRFVCEHFHSTSLHFIRFDFTLEIRVTARPLYAFTIIYFCFFFFCIRKEFTTTKSRFTR